MNILINVPVFFTYMGVVMALLSLGYHLVPIAILVIIISG